MLRHGGSGGRSETKGNQRAAEDDSPFRVPQSPPPGHHLHAPPRRPGHHPRAVIPVGPSRNTPPLSITGEPGDTLQPPALSSRRDGACDPGACSAIAYKKAEKQILGVVSFLSPTTVLPPCAPLLEFRVLARVLLCSGKWFSCVRRFKHTPWGAPW